jgi:ubiquinone/menaquinone biosynthesis C-methylase UbiE
MDPLIQQQALFDQSWNVYKKIVKADFMHHNLFMQLSAEEIRKIDSKNPISILDIGCGDASPFIPLLKIRPVASYTGYDLSEVAIAYSRKNLELTGITYELKTGNMTELIHTEPQTFDLIYSSFVIHHLSDEAKTNFFSAIAKKLKPRGKFIYIDVFRTNEISVDQYRREYAEIINNWSELDQEEKNLVINHISQFDFPAKETDLLQWFSDATLKVVNQQKADQKHIYFALELC